MYSNALKKGKGKTAKSKYYRTPCADSSFFNAYNYLNEPSAMTRST